MLGMNAKVSKTYDEPEKAEAEKLSAKKANSEEISEIEKVDPDLCTKRSSLATVKKLQHVDPLGPHRGGSDFKWDTAEQCSATKYNASLQCTEVQGSALCNCTPVDYVERADSSCLPSNSRESHRCPHSPPGRNRTNSRERSSASKGNKTLRMFQGSFGTQPWKVLGEEVVSESALDPGGVDTLDPGGADTLDLG